MDKRAIRTEDGAREIVEQNIAILYHLPPKYPCLEKALRNVRHDLLKLLQFCRKRPPIIWQQKYVWFIDNDRLTEIVRKKTTYSTSNKHFNFLCCLGAISKLKQIEGYMTGVNMTFLLNEHDNGKIRPINTFTVPRYTPKKLEEMERRAAAMLQHKITPGNISNDKMVATGLHDLAREVFYANSEKSIYKKIKDFEHIVAQLNALCDEKGYTDKRELCSRLDWSRDRLDNILNTFKKQWQQLYQYKAPNKEETELYNLSSKAWIIIRRSE